MAGGRSVSHLGHLLFKAGLQTPGPAPMFGAAHGTAAPGLARRLYVNSYCFPILLIAPILLIVLFAVLPGCGLCLCIKPQVHA